MDDSVKMWMPMYWADFLSDTSHLNATETGAYLRLIAHYWMNDGLPRDEDRLRYIARLDRSEWKKVRDTLASFFSCTPDGWIHGRIESELEKAKSMKRRASHGGFGKWGISSDQKEKETRSERLSAARRKGTHTKEQWNSLVLECGNVCVRCGATGKIVKDHIVPIYQGGSDGLENLQPLCQGCNSSKGAETTDWRPKKRLEEMPSERLRNACQNACEMPSKSLPRAGKGISDKKVVGIDEWGLAKLESAE